MPNKIFASLLTAVLLLIVNLSVGGYVVHPANIPDFLKWLEYASPQKWVTPIFTKDEYSDEAIANSGAMQLCRNKHVSHIGKFLVDVTIIIILISGSKTRDYCAAAVQN
jgi:hypothetical protein